MFSKQQDLQVTPQPQLQARTQRPDWFKAKNLARALKWLSWTPRPCRGQWVFLAPSHTPHQSFHLTLCNPTESSSCPGQLCGTLSAPAWSPFHRHPPQCSLTP